jgi:preprotein translocase subunit YajC
MVYKKQFIKQSIIILIATLLVLLTLFIPQKVRSQAESKEVKMGYPVHFVTQDFSSYNPPLPRSYNIMSGSLMEKRPSIAYANFLVSIALIVLIVEIFAFIAERSFYKSKKKARAK